MKLIHRIEQFITDYATLADPQYSLPIALWIIGTFAHMDFDAFAYLCITSAVKRSGKTRLSELISFACFNPRNFAAVTGPMVFRSMETEHPTLIFDEAEKLSSGAATDMRAILNVGYRKGQTVPRMVLGEIKEFPTYCPKIFISIGHPTDTLVDRSLLITMKRAEPAMRFTYDAVKSQGEALRREISALIEARRDDIRKAFANHRGLDFLGDRDAEIWTPLFILCRLFCPDRMKELTAAASDMSMEKTAPRRKHIDLEKASIKAEQNALTDEYKKRLLMDLYSIMVSLGAKVIASTDVLERLKADPAAPWRKFRGEGLDAIDMGNMLDSFGLGPVRIALGSGRGKQTFKRGYKLSDVQKAMEHLSS